MYNDMNGCGLKVDHQATIQMIYNGVNEVHKYILELESIITRIIVAISASTIDSSISILLILATI